MGHLIFAFKGQPAEEKKAPKLAPVHGEWWLESKRSWEKKKRPWHPGTGSTVCPAWTINCVRRSTRGTEQRTASRLVAFLHDLPLGNWRPLNPSVLHSFIFWPALFFCLKRTVHQKLEPLQKFFHQSYMTITNWLSFWSFDPSQLPLHVEVMRSNIPNVGLPFFSVFFSSLCTQWWKQTCWPHHRAMSFFCDQYPYQFVTWYTRYERREVTTIDIPITHTCLTGLETLGLHRPVRPLSERGDQMLRGQWHHSAPRPWECLHPCKGCLWQNYNFFLKFNKPYRYHIVLYGRSTTRVKTVLIRSAQLLDVERNVELLDPDQCHAACMPPSLPCHLHFVSLRSWTCLGVYCSTSCSVPSSILARWGRWQDHLWSSWHHIDLDKLRLTYLFSSSDFHNCMLWSIDLLIGNFFLISCSLSCYTQSSQGGGMRQLSVGDWSTQKSDL